MHELLASHSILFSFLIVGALNLLAVISPGPDFAVMIKTALSHPRNIAVMTALGIASGILVHVSYCILGLALIIAKSILLFSMIKFLGAAYFVYIGIKGLLAKEPKEHIENPHLTKRSISFFTAFKRGFLCNVLNPKATMFFLGLFTLIVKPSTPIWIQTLYGVEMCLITFIWFAALAVIITHRNIQHRIGHFQYYITKIMGGLLILFGVEIATLHHR